jgi:hypothetical protein
MLEGLMQWKLTHFLRAKKTDTKTTPVILFDFKGIIAEDRPHLWSSGQSYWLQILRSRVRFPALPDFLRSNGSGTWSTQPREDN